MKVLLTGACGSIGFETLKQLLVRPDTSIITLDLPSKKNIRRLRPYQDQVTSYWGSINDPEIIGQCLKGIDAIIHLAAIIPPLADQKPELTRKVNFYGTYALLEEMQKQNQNCFFIYTSSVSVYGDRIKNPWIQVGDPLQPSEGDYYALTKIETEKMIEESKLNYTIFRLTGIMGRPETDPLMFHMPLDTKLEIATTKDTAKALVSALDHQKELKQKIFNLGGGPSCRTTYRDFIQTMFSIYGLEFHDLKELAFAEKNFHCGYFKDSERLNKILHFQTESLTDYYNRIQKETKKTKHFFTKVFHKPILYFLNRKSEPLQAKKKKKESLIKRYFNRD